ncbi:MAG TPA: penicillin-binding transpeptidase domain-containing protein [Candidatus Paceibacterota bacterium]|nr:penicillin-binding transpeptidase domain-containing protein [Candidatus Paceibacterota bacterium]
MFRRKRAKIHEIAPDEIFLDSSNLPAHNRTQFEGRVERPMSRRAIFGVGVTFIAIAIVFCARAFSLQIVQGATFAEISLQNTLSSNVIFAQRGIIYDRTGTELAWNVAASEQNGTSTKPYALRQYIAQPGFSLLLGFLTYPQEDKQGNWWRTDYAGVSGLELEYNSVLEGQNGASMVETNAHGKSIRSDIVAPPVDGQNLYLSIDANIQTELYKAIVQGAAVDGFVGGAGVVMDVNTGQVLSITSFPQYDDNAFAQGDNAEIAAANQDPSSPLLDRAVGGLYAPGSIVKAIFAAGALDAGIISPDKIIVSTGALTIPNPYNPSQPSVFHDWTVHGPIDMETAIAVSSDEYFYTIAGGFGGQIGLGISGLDKYAKEFGLGTTTGIALPGEQAGLVPSPAWKATAFPEDPTWLLGDTYHTGIGQFGFQITPVQAVRYIAAIANGGKLLTPQLLASSTPEYTQVPVPDADLAVVRAGMRLAITSTRRDAIDNVLNIPGIELAVKTGTAQIGSHNQWVNSWIVGYWPADDPKYAFAVVLEKGPSTETYNAEASMIPFFQWLVANQQQYVN